MKTLIFLCLVLLVSGCSTPPVDCKTVSWEQRGLLDGKKGLHPDEITRHGTCQSADPVSDRVNYNAGHAKGLIEFCTPSHFYFAAEIGEQASEGLCPVPQREELTKNYIEGLKLKTLLSEKRAIEQEIEALEEKQESSNSFFTMAASFIGVDPASRKQGELSKVQNEINKMVLVAPDTVEYCRYELGNKAEVKKYVPSFLASLEPVKQKLDVCSRNSVVR